MMRPSRSSTSVRPPAVAGFFYPDDAAELRDTVNALISRAGAITPPGTLSYIVPHAGYMYSGGVAAVAYGHLQHSAVKPRRVVIIGPSHRVYLQGIAIPESSAFATPLGEIPLDMAAKRALLKRGDVVLSDLPHAQEHSLEVQLPFLQALFGEFELVPLVVGAAEPRYVASVLDEVAHDADTLLLASSDLSHYLSYEDARRVDADTNASIMQLSSTLSGEQACGAVALNGLLMLAKNRRASISAR
jgi:AmmeMemoRadiSam system protein B